MSMNDTYLKFGDVVALYTENAPGFFSVQGFVDNDCKFAVTTESDNLPLNFRDCLFEIHPIQQYASTEELKKYLTSSLGQRPLSDPEHKNTLNFLQDNARNEKALNKEHIKNVMGTHVTYGQTVQFLHVKSGTYVTLNTRVLSELEKDNVKAQLADGGLTSWFTILPRYKVRSEGEKVFIKDGVLFKSIKSELFLHVSSEELPVVNDTHWREVNCSLSASSWKFSLYSEWQADMHEFIKYSDIVQIFHPEEEAFVSFVSQNSNSLSLTEQAKNGTLELVKSEGSSNASSFWEVVNVARDRGGISEFQSPVMLRSLVTGAYLTVLPCEGDDDLDIDIDGSSSPSQYKLGGDLKFSDRSRVIFHFTSLMDDPRISSESSCHLEMTLDDAGHRVWVHTTTVDATNRPPSAKEGQMVGKILLARPQERTIVVSEKKREEDAMRIQFANVSEARDIYYIQSLLPVLRTFLTKIKIRRNAGIEGHEILALTNVLADLIFFTTSDMSRRDPFNVHTPPVRQRQNFLREMVVDILFDLISIPFQRTKYGPALFELDILEDEHGLFFQAIQLAYKLVIHIFKGYPRNQVYVSQWISVIVGQLGYNLYAEDCLTELLMNNRHLLEEVDDATINIFVQLLWQKGKNAKYVQFLTALCSCDGEAIEDNQERMCDLLLNNDKNADQLLIHIRQREKRVEVSWKERTGQWMDINVLANSTSAEMTRVLDYFEAVLKLFAQMCLDRNYNVISVLEKLYPRELVLKCMTMSSLPTSLRSAFIVLMLRLHIDRDEQIDVIVPRYTRVWSQVRADLPSAADSEQFQVVEEYVRDCLNSEDTDDNLLLSVLQVLRFLLVIGSFSTVEEVQDLLAAVMAAMDRPPASGRHKQALPGIPDLLAKSKLTANDNDEDSSQSNSASGTPPTGKVSQAPPSNSKDQSGGGIELVQVEGSASVGDAKPELMPADTKDSTPALPHEAPRAPPGVKKNLGAMKKLKAVSARIMHVKRLAKRRFFSFLGSDGPHAVNVVKLDSEKGGLYPNSEDNMAIINSKRQMCEILAHAADLRVDYRLSKLLLSFKTSDGSSTPLPGLMTKKESAEIISKWQDVFEEDDWRVLNLDHISPDVNVVDIFLDMLLYDNDDLVVSALNALVREYSQRRDFNKALKKVQLLKDSSAIEVYEQSKQYLVSLKTMAETEEIWKSSNVRQKKLTEMISILKKFSSYAVQETNGEPHPSSENQRILRNLGVHEHVISVLKLPFSPAYRPLFIECYAFLRKFCCKDEENQVLLYKHLNFFLEQMGANLGIPEMLTSMFDQNEELLDHVTLNLCRHFASLFCISPTPRPEILKLFCALIDAKGIPVRRNQNLVLSVINEGVMKDKVMHYLYSSPQGKKERIDLMKQREHLKPNSKLLCHIHLLTLLGHCSGGQNYIAEALCQSLLALEDAIDTVLDPMTIPDVASCALHFIRSVYFDVESQYRGLESNDKLISLISYCTQMLERACHLKQGDALRSFIMNHVLPTVTTFLKLVLPALEVQDVYGLPLLLHNLRALQSSNVSEEEHEAITTSIDLARHGIDSGQGDGFNVGESVAAEVLKGARAHRAAEDKAEKEKIKGQDASKLAKSKSRKALGTSHSSGIEEFQAFCDFVSSESSIDDDCLSELRSLVHHIKHLDVRDRPDGRLTLSFKSVTLRLIKFCSTHFNDEEVAVPILRILQEMVWTEEEDSPERASMQRKLDELGATQLMVQLVSTEGVDDDVVLQAYALGTALLHGGNLTVQDSLHEYLIRTKEEGFFYELRERVQDIIGTLREKSASGGGGGRDDFGPLPADANMTRETEMLTQILRLLQLLCEGHHTNLQNYIRVQEGNGKSVSVLHLVVELWLSIEHAVDDRMMPIAIQLFNTLTEFIQGPCIENQTALVGTKILDSANRIMRASFPDCDPDYVDDLKTIVIQMLLSLMEGRRDSLIHERLITTLDVKTLTMQLPKILHAHRQFGDDTEAGFAIFILLKTLADYDNRLFQRFDPDRMPISLENEEEMKTYREAYEYFNKSTGALEVQKEGAIFRVYFTIPDMCFHMTEASIEFLKWDVNRDTANDKVSDLMERSDDIIAEMKHQEALSKRRNLYWFASNFPVMKNISFVITLIINTLLMVFFTVPATQPTDISSTLANPSARAPVDDVIVGLGGLLSFMALFLIIAYLIQYGKLKIRYGWKQRRIAQQHVLRLPSDTHFKRLFLYGETQVYREHKSNPIIFITYWAVSLVHLFGDYLFLFYFFYFVFALVGMVWTPLFFGFHLTDIVVRSDTLKNVIKAVTNKGTQLALTGCLGLVVVYLFGALAFSQFRHYYYEADDGQFTCDSVAACFATTLIQGLGNDGGIGGYLVRPPISSTAYVMRLFFDLAFFFIVPILIMNIVFGIIIDTFAALRSAKEAKGEDMINKCFICNIDRDTFDRYARGFDHHILHDHNMWTYLFFVAYLRFKDDSEYTGIESYVAKSIKGKNIDWFPLHTAIVLEGQEEEKKETVELLRNEVLTLSSQLRDVQSQLSVILAEVSNGSGPDAASNTMRRLSARPLMRSDK